MTNAQSPFFHEERHQNLDAVRDTPITICGAGSLGGPITETLARMGYTHLTIIDRDRIEARNLSCQPYQRAQVGLFKARALAGDLSRAIHAKVEGIVGELTEKNAISLLSGTALVLDAFDNHAARAAVSHAARARGMACLHAGFSGDGLYGSGLWEPGYVVPQATAGDPCDYPLTRPFAQVLAALACRVVGEFLTEGVRQDFEVTWHDAHISLQKHVTGTQE